MLSKMSSFKTIILVGLSVLLFTCIDPYVPNLKSYKSLLVVEGLITNENKSYEIKLSRTYSHADSLPQQISDASVYLTDGDGVKTDLKNNGNGSYTTDSTIFRGTIGEKYTLHIQTADGNEYVSDECPMLLVAGIDSIYYEKDEEVIGDPAKLYVGLKLLLNTTDMQASNQYLRWIFEETWKIPIPYPLQFTYELINDTTFNFQPTPGTSPSCWKEDRSSGIIINSVISGQASHIHDQEIQFIAPLLSDKLAIEYSILVKQLSLSESEYTFWKMLKQVQEPGGDIFGTQPYSNISNIHNVAKPDEAVLGYFEVSAVAAKRIFITSDQLLSLDLPFYNSNCRSISLSPSDWPIPPPPTFDEIYHWMVDLRHFQFIKPEVADGVVLPGKVTLPKLKKLVFTTEVCAFCEKPGFSERPDFWIDLK